MRRKPERDLTLDELHATLDQAIAGLDINPEYVAWVYTRAAFLATGSNISATARLLGMHRRTLQRQLGRNAPPPRPVLPS